MEFFTTAAGISVHVWDTKDERGPVKPGMTTDDTSGLTGGPKPCLLLLHGYLETMYIFTEFVDALKKDFRIIVIDLPGHGLTDSASAGPDGPRVNTLPFMAEVAVGVLDKCGVEKAFVAGHSLGGYVAMNILRDYPERVERAVMLHSHPYPDLPEKAADRAHEQKIVAAGKLHLLAGASIPKMYYEENLRACDEKIRETIELCETHDPEGIIATIEGMRTRPDYQEVMKNPPVPLLLVYGDHDNFLPLERVEEMKKLFPKVAYRLVPESGHNSFIEHPEAALAAVLDFTKGSC